VLLTPRLTERTKNHFYGLEHPTGRQEGYSSQEHTGA
jgi:hypothetical protein